jgi:hypothetical protein
MDKAFKKFIVALMIASLFLFPMAGVNGSVQAEDSFPPTLEPSLSVDGLTLYNGVPPLVVVVDPNPAMQGIQVPAEPEVVAAIEAAVADPDTTSAAFSFTFMAAGDTDPWGAVCQDFPAAAKTAFNAAAAIWTATIQSPVPITISACWSSPAYMPSPGTLGYSGGATSYRDFTGAPKPNTWYESSLANALHGSDIDASKFDDYITYNSGFTWYYGTDGVVPAGQYDLVMVATHEIAHGLNFSGSAKWASGGTGSFGFDGFPYIYDTFMEALDGTKLTAYTNPSTDLGSLLTSESLWFNGSNANAANGGTRVKMYAPPSWSSGSSYAHLDEIFNGTVNDMMTYSVGSGSANHNPGPVTKGLLKDLGWVLTGGSTGSSIYLPLVVRNFAGSLPGNFNKSTPAHGATDQPANPTLSWGASSKATSYEYCIDTSNNNACNTTWISTGTSTSVALSGLTPGTRYWQVRAKNGSGTTNANGGTWWSFTTTTLPVPGAFNKSSPPDGATSQPANPTLSWGASSKVTSYEYCINTTASCTAPSKWISTGTNTSAGLSGLTPAIKYYWQVHAKNVSGTTNANGGTWWSFTTAGSPTSPTAGFWESTTGDEFYVTPDQANVDNFAIYIDVTGCVSYKITHLTAEPIVGNQFSFSGPFSASGTFDSTTSAHGIDALSSFITPDCGTVTGGPWDWTATWQNSSQPASIIERDAQIVVLEPESQMPYYSHTITIK